MRPFRPLWRRRVQAIASRRSNSMVSSGSLWALSNSRPEADTRLVKVPSNETVRSARGGDPQGPGLAHLAAGLLQGEAGQAERVEQRVQLLHHTACWPDIPQRSHAWGVA